MYPLSLYKEGNWKEQGGNRSMYTIKKYSIKRRAWEHSPNKILENTVKTPKANTTQDQSQSRIQCNIVVGLFNS